ncbi:MAG: NAD(P)/FAD-dependent oxidoreductase [Gammaproteobacteria bacterium]
MKPFHNVQDVSAAVIGGGPAGLMAAEMLSRAGVEVHVFDAMPSVGRKLLMAGKSGLNITHAESHERFLSRYGASEAFLKPMLDAFGPDALRQWAAELGIETFTGSSGRVFPQTMKAAPLLRAWLHRLREGRVRFHMRHQWLGWADEGGLDADDAGRLLSNQHNLHRLSFATPTGVRELRVQALILAMGGASWPALGSTGAWAAILQQKGVVVELFRPSNCGFKVSWSDHFKGRYAGEPVKSVALSVPSAGEAPSSRRGEFVITEDGVEGSLIYALSSLLREQIGTQGETVIHLDLTPDRDAAQLTARLAAPRGKQSFANHLRKCAKLDGVKAALLREQMPDIATLDACRQAAAIKALPIVLQASSAIDEAISTAGGVSLSELDGKLMLKRLSGVFCAGEMLAWDAPTGGYLLTACFATGRQAGLGALEWLQNCSVKEESS